MTSCWVALVVSCLAPDPWAAGTVHQVHLTIPAAEYAAMQPRRAPGGFFGPAPKTPPPKADPGRELHRNNFGMDLPWATGTVRVGDQVFTDVAVRYKGNGTIGDAGQSVKKSFKVDLDRRGGSGRFLGSKSINLHCGVTDPSKLREALGYRLYRAAGVPAPRTAFAEVRLTVPGKYDGEFLGLYTLTEEVDAAFLRDRFGSSAGLLMKPEGVREVEFRGDKWERYKAPYRPKREATAAEGERVVAFARLVHQADDAAFEKEVGSFLDVDAYLRFLAATTFVANPDSFFAMGHNYYLYLHPDTRRFHFVPWDLDRAFANLPTLGTYTQQMNLSLTRPYGGRHRLTERVLALPGVTEKYQALVRELTAGPFGKERLLKELDAAEAEMRELMARDAAAAAGRKEDTAPGTKMFGVPPPLRKFVERRTASVAAQLAGTSKGHIPASGPGEMGDMMAGPVLENWDADDDGHLSRAEWLALARRVFAACQADAGGRVDQAALAAGLNDLFPKPPPDSPKPPPGFSLGERMSGPILAKADADKDGKLTADELLTAAGKLFDEYDPKKTGKLDANTLGKLLNTLFPKF